MKMRVALQQVWHHQCTVSQAGGFHQAANEADQRIALGIAEGAGDSLRELLCTRRRALYPAECILQTIGKASPLQVSRLVEEADRSCIHCPRSYSVVGIGGYENERNVESEMRQMLLQLEAAHVRHLYVGYQTGGFLHP